MRLASGRDYSKAQRRSGLSDPDSRRQLPLHVKSDPSDLRTSILGLLGRRDYRPLDKIEMARELGLKSNQRVELRKMLRALEHGGEIARIRKNRYVLPDEADLVTGTLSIHPSAFAFLVTEKEGEGDIFIAAENTGTAMNGDPVVAR